MRDIQFLVRSRLSCKISDTLTQNKVPWHRPWAGSGNNLGFHRDFGANQKFFGINFILLQMAAKQKGFASKWWGTTKVLGITREEEIAYYMDKDYITKNYITKGTEVVSYANNNFTTETVYNIDQLRNKPCYESDLTVNYELGETVLNNVPVRKEINKDKQALYYFPPYNYITMPSKEVFAASLPGLPAYYECLAHELMHYTEYKLKWNTEFEAIRELRAEIGAAMLMQELNLPHSVNFANIRKWNTAWINFMERDTDLIFKVAAAASRGVDYILSFSNMSEGRLNEMNENAA